MLYVTLKLMNKNQCYFSPRVPDVCASVVFVGRDERDLSLIIVKEHLVGSLLVVKLQGTQHINNSLNDIVSAETLL